MPSKKRRPPLRERGQVVEPPPPPRPQPTRVQRQPVDSPHPQSQPQPQPRRAQGQGQGRSVELPVSRPRRPRSESRQPVEPPPPEEPQQRRRRRGRQVQPPPEPEPRRSRSRGQPVEPPPVPEPKRSRSRRHAVEPPPVPEPKRRRSRGHAVEPPPEPEPRRSRDQPVEPDPPQMQIRGGLGHVVEPMEMEVPDPEEENMDVDVDGENITEESTAARKLQEMFEQTCTMYRVGPLLNFKDSSQRRFMRYSRKVLSALIDKLPSNLTEKYKYRVEFSRLDEVRIYPDDNSSIYIEVSRGHDPQAARRGRRRTNVPPKIVFAGLFTSMSAEGSRNYQKSKHHPLFICTQTHRKILDVVLNQLDKMFCCCFLPYNINWSGMTYLTASSVLSNGIEEGYSLKFTYSQSISDREVVHDGELEFDLDIWTTTWKKWSEESLERSTSVIDRDRYIRDFWRKLDNFMQQLNGTKIGSMNFTKICLPTIVVTSDGRVKAQIDDLQSARNILMDLSRLYEDFTSRTENLEYGRLRIYR